MFRQHSDVHAEIDRREAASIEAVRGWVAQPSFSDTGEGMAEAAVYTRNLLGTIAPDARIVPTEGYPMVVGSVRAKQQGAPTLLVYGLYDVTPLFEHEWTVDPLAGEIVDARDIGITSISGAVLTGRGVNNHKGPVLASILAVKALLDVTGDVPVNLIYVIEGEEEIGSPSMAGFVRQHWDLLNTADGCWLPTHQQSTSGAMNVRRAYKGALFTDIECKGGEWGGTRDARHIWAGHSAWIASPPMQLVRGLSTLFNDEQRATIDGIADELTHPMDENDPFIAELRERFRANPNWEQDLLTNMNAAGFLGGKDLAHHLVHYMIGTTINIQGLSSGYQGPAFYTNMPGSANAKVDIRFTPGISYEKVAELVQNHLKNRGYAGIQLKNWRGYDGSPALPLEEDTLLHAAKQTAANYYDIPVNVWPIANNCSPASLLTMLDKHIPYSVVGLGHGDRPHAPDEYITLDSTNKMMHWTVDYLHTWASVMQQSATASTAAG